MTQHAPITVIGAGSWGTALAINLSRNGVPTRLWDIDSVNIQTMIDVHSNERYLPGCAFPELLQPVVDLEKALDGINDILLAVPSHVFQKALVSIQPLIHDATRIAWATKGFDDQNVKLLSSVLRETLGDDYPYAVLSGPSFAKEVAQGVPTAVNIASKDNTFAQDLKHRLVSDVFAVDVIEDVIGVQVCGAVKNVIAIASGIVDGLNYGVNTHCALVTKGLAEMTTLGEALGADVGTFSQLAGVGDLVLTCGDDQSRNRRFGLALAKRQSPIEAEKTIGQVVEGKINALTTFKMAQALKVNMPIVFAVHDVLTQGANPKCVVEACFALQ